MADEKKISNNKNLFLAELDACRTGEEQDASRISEEDLRVIKHLDQISKFISNAKPDPGEIPESVDNVVLGHIKEKSRKIRREQKVIWLSPSYKWAAAAVMGVLVCVVSFNLVYKMNKSADNSSNNNTTSMLVKLPKDVNEKAGVIGNRAKPVKAELASTESLKEKPGMKMVRAEANFKNTVNEKLKQVPAMAAEDIDGNGRVNIIDAYLMNRRLMSGVAMPKKLDLNGDGRIDHEDIKAIVKTSVSLRRGDV